MIFHFTNDFDLCSRDRIELTSGDSMGMTARVHGGRVMGSACFALYERGKYGSTALANITEWSLFEGKGYVDYFGILRLNTEALTALIGTKDTVEVVGEWEIRYTNGDSIITKTFALSEVVIHNDYIKQFPPSPITPEDAYAKESFVENILKDRVALETEAALGSIRDEAEVAATTATEARDATKLVAAEAGVSSESARLRALSAQDSASRASGSASLAKRSELACEDYAKLSRESATNAASSSITATNAASEAQAAAKRAEDVAGSLGGEVAEAKQSAVEAKASATSAGQSALEAKTEVGKIGGSVSTAQTAASQAQASANAASGHASTASTKATQAGTSATNAASSESKAKASETAAGTSASQAAGSATTASGHASTANTKATQAGASATAASTSATQAASSATTAQGHANTASTKAAEAAGRATAAADYSVLAGKARDAAVTAKTAAEAAADRAEAASGGGVTEAQVNTKISAHDTSAAAHSAEMAKKLDKPTGGTAGQVLTKTASGTAWSDATGGGSAFDDVFEVDYAGGADINITAKNTDKPIILTSGSGWNMLSTGGIFICSYSGILSMCGDDLNMGTNNYQILQGMASGGVILGASTVLTLYDSSGNFTLGDLARVGDVRYIESPTPQSAVSLSDWPILPLPAGWYKVEVLLFAAPAISVGKVLRDSTIQAGRIYSVQGMAYGASGSTYCYFVTSSSWSGGGGGTISCSIMRLSFAYKHIPANGVDWMLTSDLVKFYGGSVRYTAVNMPQQI